MTLLKALVEWKRSKEDDKAPTSKADLQKRWNETKSRSDLTVHERLSTKKLTDEALITEILTTS